MILKWDLQNAGVGKSFRWKQNVVRAADELEGKLSFIRPKERESIRQTAVYKAAKEGNAGGKN